MPMMRISLLYERLSVVNNSHHKVLTSIFLILLLLVGVLSAVFLSQQQQDTRQRAATPTIPPGTVALVRGEAITKDFLRQKALEQYKPEAITDEVLAIMLENEIEKRLVEQQAQKEQINMSDAASVEQANLLYPNEETLTPAMLAQGRQLLLKDAVSKRLSRTREAYTIGFWIPPDKYGGPLTPSQQQTILAQRRVVPQFISEVKQRLEAGEAALVIAQDMLKKYPVLQPILAVNGYLLDRTENTELLTTPVLYTYSDQNASTPLFATLFSLQKGQIKEAQSPTSTGALIIKVVSASDGQFENYKAWLETQKQQAVRIIQPL